MCSVVSGQCDRQAACPGRDVTHSTLDRVEALRSYRCLFRGTAGRRAAAIRFRPEIQRSIQVDSSPCNGADRRQAAPLTRYYLYNKTYLEGRLYFQVPSRARTTNNTQQGTLSPAFLVNLFTKFTSIYQLFISSSWPYASALFTFFFFFFLDISTNLGSLGFLGDTSPAS